MLAGCGGFIAALGIAFTAVATSPFALAFTLGGLALASVGMHVEVGQLLGLSVENIGKASHESAIRRQKAKKLALEESKLAIEVQKLDLKAKRLAHDPASLTQASASVATSVATGVAAPVSTFAAAPPRGRDCTGWRRWWRLPRVNIRWGTATGSTLPTPAGRECRRDQSPLDETVEPRSGCFPELLSAGLGLALQGVDYQQDRLVRVCQHGLRGPHPARADPAFLLRAGSLERQPMERGHDDDGGE